MNTKLKNKIVIITGGSSGLGREIAINCLENDMKVVMVDKISPSFLSKYEDSDTLFFKIDVSLNKSVKKVINNTIKKFGKIDFLINNAGVGDSLSFANDMSERDWDKIINTNLRSVFLFCKECVNDMIKNKSGHIINIASIAGVTGLPYFSIYSASKGGIIAFSKALRQELKQFNIKSMLFVLVQ